MPPGCFVAGAGLCARLAIPRPPLRGALRVLVAEGLLYMVSTKGIATCLDAQTGDVVWQQRLGGNYSASPLLAAGKLYFTNEAGTTHVLAPGRTFRDLSQNQHFGRTCASMAVYREGLLLRTDTQLYRLQAE